jgi:hypothetical protein
MWRIFRENNASVRHPERSEGSPWLVALCYHSEPPRYAWDDAREEAIIFNSPLSSSLQSISNRNALKY